MAPILVLGMPLHKDTLQDEPLASAAVIVRDVTSTLSLGTVTDRSSFPMETEPPVACSGFVVTLKEKADPYVILAASTQVPPQIASPEEAAQLKSSILHALLYHRGEDGNVEPLITREVADRMGYDQNRVPNIIKAKYPTGADMAMGRTPK